MTPPSAAALDARRAAPRASLLHRARRLSAQDWRGVTEAAVLLCRIALRLRRRDFPALLDAFGLRDEAVPAPPPMVARAVQLVRWAHRIAPLQPNCLLDSLAAAVWLRRRGFTAPLSIGVKLAAGGTMEAHAWLGECDRSAADFRLLYRVPANWDSESTILNLESGILNSDGEPA